MVYAVMQGEPLADLGLRVMGDDVFLDEEIKRAAFDCHSRNLDALDIDAGAAISRLDAGRDGDGAIALEDRSQKPVGSVARGAVDLQEIDVRRRRDAVLAEVEVRTGDAPGDLIRDPRIPLGGRRDDSGTGFQSIAFNERQLMVEARSGQQED
ncbi:MAG: hypothetical protein JWO80_2356 [Bryobacterales bacterium]|nr:hypothetical protein [Bryobacterales bacterium]